MSRVELSAIQTKLKAAIQSHQMLVVKMKGDSQNASLKKGLSELQEEIKRLSEEQKKIVVRVRENLVKSSSQTQPQQPVVPVATLAQTITAIGQPRLVSFPTQGGATILPVGMVAVPIAHMQRPAVGMTIHPASTGPLSQATSISLIPTGIISNACNISLSPINSGAGNACNISLSPINSGAGNACNISLSPINSGAGNACNISLNPINSGATISLGNTVSGIIHGNISINNLGNTNLISTTASVGSSNSGISIIDSTIQNNICSVTGSHGGGASVVSGCIPSSGSALANLTNMTNLIIGTNISNGQGNSNHVFTNNSMCNSNCSINMPSSSAMLPVMPSAPVNTINVSSSAPGIVISQFPQQPLVQPQLLQQQQQQILQMIQQQQQQPQQQRLASHTPIKVPQYTASVIKPTVSSTSYQFCNIAPAPSTATTASSARVVTSSTPLPLPTKPVFSKEVAVPKELQPVVKQDVVTLQQQIQPPKQQQKQHEIHQQQQKPEQTPVAIISPEEQEKLVYMKALDLFTVDALKEVLKRRSERKRRTTANPNYSFGFEFSRRDRNGTLWTAISPKKPRKGKGASASANGWTDSTSLNHQQQRASNKSKSNDNHDDYCAACGKGGQLLMCETCRLVYHLDCLNPRLTEAPKYAWSCPKCLISGKGFAHLNSEALAKVHSYIAKKSAKEEEKKKVQRKGKEINTEKNMLDNRSKELDAKIKEQTDLQSKLSAEEKKVKDELSKLADFVRAMRESRTATST